MIHIGNIILKRKNYENELLNEISILENELQIKIQLFKTVDEDFLKQKIESNL